jgi:hypothetical protein
MSLLAFGCKINEIANHFLSLFRTSRHAFLIKNLGYFGLQIPIAVHTMYDKFSISVATN